jgi:hypothetical protein
LEVFASVVAMFQTPEKVRQSQPPAPAVAACFGFFYSLSDGAGFDTARFKPEVF